MKNIALVGWIVLALASCRSLSHTAAPPQEKSIVILFENDVHCAIDGYAKIAGLRNAIADTAHVGIVSSGDFLQGGTIGAISKGRYIIDILNRAKYDAVGIGNHEFDYKTPTMLDLFDHLNTPVVCANLRNAESGILLFRPFIIKNYGSKKIAFVGIITPAVRYLESYAFVDSKGTLLYDLCENFFLERVQESVNQARSQGADFVVLLSHLGDAPDSLHYDSRSLILNTTGIDVVIDGHSHSTIPIERLRNKAGKEVVLAQTGSKFQNIGKLLFSKNGESIVTSLIPTDSVKERCASVQQTIDSIKAISEKFTEQVVGTSDYKLRIYDDEGKRLVRTRETNAGNISADAFRAVFGSDIGITNGGSIRSEINAGMVKMGDVIDLLPYDNHLYEIEVEGKRIEQLLTKTTQALPAESGDFPQVSGITFEVDEKNHSVRNILIFNRKTNEYEPIRMEGIYTIATTNFCIYDGGFSGILKNCKVTQTSTLLYNEALAEYIRTQLGGRIGEPYATTQGRIRIINE